MAKSLRIKDEAGNVRVLVEPDSVALLDKNGKQRLVLMVQDDAKPWAGFMDEKGAEGLTLGQSGIDLYDAHDRHDAHIFLWKETSAAEPGLPREYAMRAQLNSDVVALYDAKGNVIWQAPPK